MATTTRSARTHEAVNSNTVAEDDGGSAFVGTATATATAPSLGTPTNRLSTTFAQMTGETAEEITGSYTPPSVESGAKTVDDLAAHRPVSGTGNATEFDPAPTSTESMGEESGLESVEGVDARALTESRVMDESAIPDAFTADAALDDKEFLPILTKLAPVLLSTVLPVIKKRVLNRRTLGRVASVVGTATKLLGGKAQESEAVESDEDLEAEMEAAAEQLEVIIGTDDRTRIRNTTDIPWRRICHLTIRARNGSQYVGTGFMIGKRTVITAGHCVYIHSAGGWPSYIDVAPGRNGGLRPYGSVRAVTFRSVTGWVSNSSRDYDYGAIILPANTPAPIQALGGFGFGHWNDASLLNRMVNLSGYPGDGGKLGPERETGSQWWMARAIKSVSARSFAYDIDTVGGQSGSPVWTVINGQRIALGIHTNGYVGGNSATRITQPVFENLKAWRTQGGS